MARRPRSGWELHHRKRSLKGATMKDLHRRRRRRKLAELLRSSWLPGQASER